MVNAAGYRRVSTRTGKLMIAVWHSFPPFLLYETGRRGQGTYR